MRTLSRVKGRSGVPTIKKLGPEMGWRVEYSGTGFQLKPLSLSAFPTPDAHDPARYGWLRVSVEHLTGRRPVKGEKVPAVFGFDYIEKTKSENASDGA